MTLEELRRLVSESEDVLPADVAPFLVASEREPRLLARAAIAQTAIRSALEACSNLAREQGYGDQATLTAIQRLMSVCDIDEPYIETLKQLGIQAAAAGNIESAMQYLQEAVTRGFTSGQRRDHRSRRSMRYAHDIEIDRAIESVSGYVGPPRFRLPVEPFRVTALCSGLQDEDGPTVITVKRTEYFREFGFDIEIVSTEMGSSAETRAEARISQLGIPLVKVPRGTWEQRARWLVAYFEAKPADAIVYMTSAVDGLAKLAACIGLSPVQSWDTRALEPQVGKFDLINQGLHAEQESKTRWPGKSRYTGPSVGIADEIDAAHPFERAELGVPREALLLATFGRLEKCNTSEYLEPLARVLASNPRAWLLLAGPDGLGVAPAIRGFFAAQSVEQRVLYLGRRQSDGPRLLKTIDIYCDTHPWPGGQSLMDAMQAGVPIVAMRRANDAILDPTGAGATTAVADVMLSGLVPLADAGDTHAYARLVQAYLDDSVLRARHGALLHEKAVRDCNMRAATSRYAQFITEIIRQKNGGSLASDDAHFYSGASRI